MPTFAISHPYFTIVVCLFICVLGITSLAQMPVDMFPPINIPVVLVATFYNGMPPEQIEAEFFAKGRPSSLLQRMIEPDEIANLVAYVASPLSSATNGAALRVDGGVTPTIG